MRRLFFAAVLVLSLFSMSYGQPLSHQHWQSWTIASDSITVSCAKLFLPYDEGRLLVETNPTTTRGEMDSALRSAHPARILLVPQTGTTDTLSAINGCNIDGAVIQLSTGTTGHTITIPHNANIRFSDALPFTLDSTDKIVTLVRKGGVWVSAMSGGIGSNIEIANNCAHATAFDKLCVDRLNRVIYLGTGTGIVPIAGGSGGGGCTGLDNCFDMGNTIDGLNGRTNALKLLDSNKDGFLIYVGASGPVIECVTDFGLVTEAGCIPTAQKTFALYPAHFSPDGTYAQYAFSQALNSGRVPATITMGDNDASTITAIIPMPDSWDGIKLRMQVWLHTAEATPDGFIRLTWSGYCVSGTVAGAPGGTGAYATETANGDMLFDLNGLAQHRQIWRTTVWDIPLSGCVGGVQRILWVRARVEEPNTTADNLSQQHFFMFTGAYGLSSFD